MKAIVAVDLNWGIGFQGNLLKRIPADMQFFKEMTLGKLVVMGRATFESLPGQQPLKDRVNLVLTRNTSFEKENVRVCHSVADCRKIFSKFAAEDICIIGGEAIYKEFLPYCKEAYVTILEARFPADKYFVNLDQLQNWEIASQGEAQSYQDMIFRFVKYVNREVKA